MGAGMGGRIGASKSRNGGLTMGSTSVSSRVPYVAAMKAAAVESCCSA